jgi:hypothetical protein
MANYNARGQLNVMGSILAYEPRATQDMVPSTLKAGTSECSTAQTHSVASQLNYKCSSSLPFPHLNQEDSSEALGLENPTKEK